MNKHCHTCTCQEQADAFLLTHLTRDTNSQTPVADIYRAYLTWAARSEPCRQQLTQIQVTKRIRAAGFNLWRKKDGNVAIACHLSPDPYPRPRP